MMEAVKIKAAFLYPDIFCLNGDRGNVMALMNTAERLGLHIEVDRINLPDEKIDFAA
ncbi:MAG: glutamine amidotransferase, partial [Eubacteriaceae bacterium]|nr:glutamine amidotransferase [Eubacteriaceae bacterium]